LVIAEPEGKSAKVATTADEHALFPDGRIVSPQLLPY
jgi:hypothetical protein